VAHLSCSKWRFFAKLHRTPLTPHLALSLSA
jgi:hypothetical protein